MAITKAGTVLLAALRDEGTQSVCTYDGLLSDVAGDIYPGVHALDRIQMINRRLRTDERFEQSLMRAHDFRGRPCRLTLHTVKDAVWNYQIGDPPRLAPQERVMTQWQPIETAPE